MSSPPTVASSPIALRMVAATDGLGSFALGKRTEIMGSTALLFVAGHVGEFQLSWIVSSQTANDRDGDFPNGKDLIVEREEKNADVLGLGQVSIESEKFFYNIPDYLECMITGLVDNRIADVELTACQSSRLPNFWVFIFDVLDCDIPDELVQNMSGEIEAAKSVERQLDLGPSMLISERILGVLGNNWNGGKSVGVRRTERLEGFAAEHHTEHIE
ncbi:hypothetical protein HG531_005797 [Fusarium graminearum]|nr:hypothetical protein HG531_005797 [Fusarium graminearum]